MSVGLNGSNHTNGKQAYVNGHTNGALSSPTSLELKRGGFIASYPPFETLQPEHVSGIWDKKPFGLYVHLPYCRKRCTFCFYKVYTNRNAKPMDKYLQAVFNEIDAYGAKPELRERRVDTVYFGGGTPTTLSVEQLRELVARLKRNFDIRPDVEFTCEAEPGTLDAEKVACLRELGVTRLSMGVQTFDDELLRRNGRSHSSESVYAALEMARANNFPVVNLDLMSGILDETPETWDRSVQALIDLNIEHVSIYRMEVYKNTLLYAAGYTGPGVGGIPTDDEELVLWLAAVDKLERAGYTQVTGHAFIKKPEYDHTQRADIWGGGEVLGMGLSSYSYLNNTVFQNTSDWGDYLGRASSRQTCVGRALRLNSRQQMTREFILGLKLLTVDRAQFRSRHGFDVVDLYQPQIDALVKDDLLTVTPGAIELTRRARSYVDLICSVFYLPEHADYRFHRFATDEDLAKTAILQLDQFSADGFEHRSLASALI
jgi:oxygen-independent coproporphyrinogen-3 oxidase